MDGVTTNIEGKDATAVRCCGPDGCGQAGPDGLRYCIGLNCMAWRETTQALAIRLTKGITEQEARELSHGRSYKIDNIDAGPWGTLRAPSLGKCGLVP